MFSSQGLVGSSRPRSSRAAAALATMAKGDDKLTRKAEEQAAKVTFFNVSLFFNLLIRLRQSMESSNIVFDGQMLVVILTIRVIRR